MDTDKNITFLLVRVEQVANAFVEFFGEAMCEVLILDFRNPEHPIHWIRGELTNRHIGGAMSQIGLELLAQGKQAHERLNYLTRTPDGKLLKSSIIPLLDTQENLFGAFCIKFDVTTLTSVEQHLRQFLSTEDSPMANNVYFSDSPTSVAQAILDDAMHHLKFITPPSHHSERLELVRILKQRGFFELRRSPQLLATFLHISRAFVYNLLKELEMEPQGSDASLRSACEPLF